MTNILILDTETTGLTENDSHVIEIATILYNVEHKSILQQLSTLLPVEENPQEKVNKISSACSMVAMPYYDILSAIKKSFNYCDYIVAHNAEFDKKWMEKCGLKELLDKHWICSFEDFEWDTNNKKLTEIAISLEIPIVSAHRALADCQLLAACFSKIENLSERIEKSLIPRFIYRANVSYDDRMLAKNAGFYWGKHKPNSWTAMLTEEQAAALSFSVTKMDN